MIRAAKFTIAFATLGLLHLPAFSQQLKARDIAGVKLGATAEQAEAALKAFNSKVAISKMLFRPEDGGQPSMVASIRASTDQGLGASQMETDNFWVQFAETTGKVIAITRIHTVDLINGTKFSMDIVGAAMSEKYGFPWTYKIDRSLGIGLSAAGSPDKKCIDGTGADGNSRLVGCGDSFSVRFENGPGNGLYTWYRATLVDSAAAIEDIKATNAKREARKQSAERQAQEAARKAKPAL